MHELFALDIETTGLDRFSDRILCIGVYAPSFQRTFDSADDFNTWLSARKNTARFIMHNGSFDVNFIRQYGYDISSHWAYDTRSIASILVPRPRTSEGQKSVFGLENLSIQLLGALPYKLDRTQMGSYSRDEVAAYCLKDCELTYKLFIYLEQQLANKDWDFVEDWLIPATKLCAELEWNGVHVDQEGLRTYQKIVEQERDQVLVGLRDSTQQAISYYHEKQVQEVRETYREMYEKAKAKAKDQEKCRARYQTLEELALCKLEPFNWNSSEQLKWLLRDYYCLDIHNEREDKETTNEAMLKSLDHPIAKKLAAYRELEKLCSTCIPALLENCTNNQTIHAHYTVGGTRTGRLSSSGPNLQQIPKGPLRSYIRACDGEQVLLTVDYAQIEVRIIAELASETELINAFKAKIDPYSVIAQKLLKIDCDVREIKERFKKERDVSKTAGLSILYGTGPAKLQEVLNKELNKNYSLNECRDFIKDYRAQFPGVQRLRKQLERALANGKTHYNLLGRPFSIESNDDLYMKALNTLVQGSASDLVLFSQTKFVKPALDELNVNYKYRLLVHDEVVIELPANEAELLAKEVIIPAMTTQIKNWLNLVTPLEVEYTISREWAKP